MIALTTALLAQLAAATPQPSPPVLSFPEPGLDDRAAYQGYETRFYRDAARNTVQLYLDHRASRVVHLWADAENASAGFTARDARGRAAPLRWSTPDAIVSASGRTRTVDHHLVADAPAVSLGWFLLGSMRVERDFQYERRQRGPFAAAPYRVAELDRLVAALAALDPATRRRHLALLGAADLATLRARLAPTVTVRRGEGSWTARVAQSSLDARDTLAVEIAVDPRAVAAAHAGDSITLRARTGRAVPFTLRVSTTGAALSPLARAEIFTPAFLAFVGDVAAAARDSASPAGVRARRLERQVRGVELLASRDKLMAGLPTYATYFGRDMMVTALMMRPIWRAATSEAVIASVLRKLSPRGEVSHEEALGGQAVREAAAEYAALADSARTRGRTAAARDSVLARAEAVLRDHRRTRENYHMIDDELQLPVLVARWMSDPEVPDERKRAFLLDSADGGGRRLARLLRELALVARLTAPYAREPVPANLVGFPPRDSGQWASASWRDSRAGYAAGRYAMDVNAIWAPLALASAGRILADARALGLPLDLSVPELSPQSPLGRYARDPAALAAAVATWEGAARHFLVRLGPADVRARVGERLAAMPAAERAHWSALPTAATAVRDSLAFLAVALDARGQPIAVANTDPATRLFLGAGEGARGAPDPEETARVLRDVRLFVRPYPAGLLVPQVGPVVANDAYTAPPVWREFVRDPYHGPRVVWGRELNLFLLGVAGRMEAAGTGAGAAAYVGELRSALATVRAAAEASGFHSELWSYEVAGGKVVPTRYGTGADVQLWSTTDLAVQFALSRLGAP